MASELTLWIGHISLLFGIFFSFISIGIMDTYKKIISGGAVAKSTVYSMMGILILTLDIILIYFSALTGKLDLLNISGYWPAIGIITFFGFGLLAYAQYILWRAATS